jgi:hypothetical protein
MLSGEAANINFKSCGLTRSGLETTIHRTRDKHVNHYTTDAVTNVYISPEDSIISTKVVLWILCTPLVSSKSSSWFRFRHQAILCVGHHVILCVGHQVRLCVGHQVRLCVGHQVFTSKTKHYNL